MFDWLDGGVGGGSEWIQKNISNLTFHCVCEHSDQIIIIIVNKLNWSNVSFKLWKKIILNQIFCQCVCVHVCVSNEWTSTLLSIEISIEQFENHNYYLGSRLIVNNNKIDFFLQPVIIINCHLKIFQKVFMLIWSIQPLKSLDLNLINKHTHTQTQTHRQTWPLNKCVNLTF